ncbi:putative serine/threonine-protein kinase [Smittium culicis]|uniref:Putative serine/threonine-protein kinase n=1 Tax=Smittium culicis TaxID=133412 RepID=A0A1R1XQA4_9FUNG|nr:putative serine/threonine-protein kinase [Smittium culicis]
MNHPNVIKLLDNFKEGYHSCLVFELMDFDLNVYSERNSGKRFSPTFIMDVTCQILSGLSHIHEQGFFHRDLKPENILLKILSDKIIVKISDFGLVHSMEFPRPLTSYISTRWYRAPEVLLACKFYAKPVDVWAVGTIVAELANSKPIFPGNNQLDQLRRIFDFTGSPNSTSNTESEWMQGILAANDLGLTSVKLPTKTIDNLIPEVSPVIKDFVAFLLKLNPDLRPSSFSAYNKAKSIYSDLTSNNLPLLPTNNTATSLENDIKTLGDKTEKSPNSNKIDTFPLKNSIENMPLVNKDAISPLANKPDNSPIVNKPANSTIVNKLDNIPIVNKDTISPLSNKPDNSPLAKKPDNSPLANKPDNSTIANKTDYSTIVNKSENSLISNKLDNISLINKLDNISLINKLDNSHLANKSENSPLINKSENKPLEIKTSSLDQPNPISNYSPFNNSTSDVINITNEPALNLAANLIETSKNADKNITVNARMRSTTLRPYRQSNKLEDNFYNFLSQNTQNDISKPKTPIPRAHQNYSNRYSGSFERYSEPQSNPQSNTTYINANKDTQTKINSLLSKKDSFLPDFNNTQSVPIKKSFSASTIHPTLPIKKKHISSKIEGILNRYQSHKISSETSSTNSNGPDSISLNRASIKPLKKNDSIYNVSNQKNPGSLSKDFSVEKKPSALPVPNNIINTNESSNKNIINPYNLMKSINSTYSGNGTVPNSFVASKASIFMKNYSSNLPELKFSNNINSLKIKPVNRNRHSFHSSSFTSSLPTKNNNISIEKHAKAHDNPMDISPFNSSLVSNKNIDITFAENSQNNLTDISLPLDSVEINSSTIHTSSQPNIVLEKKIDNSHVLPNSDNYQEKVSESIQSIHTFLSPPTVQPLLTNLVPLNGPEKQNVVISSEKSLHNNFTNEFTPITLNILSKNNDNIENTDVSDALFSDNVTPKLETAILDSYCQVLDSSSELQGSLPHDSQYKNSIDIISSNHSSQFLDSSADEKYKISSEKTPDSGKIFENINNILNYSEYSETSADKIILSSNINTAIGDNSEDVGHSSDAGFTSEKKISTDDIYQNIDMYNNNDEYIQSYYQINSQRDTNNRDLLLGLGSVSESLNKNNTTDAWPNSYQQSCSSSISSDGSLLLLKDIERYNHLALSKSNESQVNNLDSNNYNSDASNNLINVIPRPKTLSNIRNENRSYTVYDSLNNENADFVINNIDHMSLNNGSLTSKDTKVDRPAEKNLIKRPNNYIKEPNPPEKPQKLSQTHQSYSGINLPQKNNGLFSKFPFKTSSFSSFKSANINSRLNSRSSYKGLNPSEVPNENNSLNKIPSPSLNISKIHSELNKSTNPLVKQNFPIESTGNYIQTTSQTSVNTSLTPDFLPKKNDYRSDVMNSIPHQESGINEILDEKNDSSFNSKSPESSKIKSSKDSSRSIQLKKSFTFFRKSKIASPKSDTAESLGKQSGTLNKIPESLTSPNNTSHQKPNLEGFDNQQTWFPYSDLEKPINETSAFKDKLPSIESNSNFWNSTPKQPFQTNSNYTYTNDSTDSATESDAAINSSKDNNKYLGFFKNKYRQPENVSIGNSNIKPFIKSLSKLKSPSTFFSPKKTEIHTLPSLKTATANDYFMTTDIKDEKLKEKLSNLPSSNFRSDDPSHSYFNRRPITISVKSQKRDHTTGSILSGTLFQPFEDSKNYDMSHNDKTSKKPPFIQNSEGKSIRKLTSYNENSSIKTSNPLPKSPVYDSGGGKLGLSLNNKNGRMYSGPSTPNSIHFPQIIPHRNYSESKGTEPLSTSRPSLVSNPSKFSQGKDQPTSPTFESNSSESKKLAPKIYSRSRYTINIKDRPLNISEISSAINHDISTRTLSNYKSIENSDPNLNHISDSIVKENLYTASSRPFMPTPSISYDKHESSSSIKFPQSKITETMSNEQEFRKPRFYGRHSTPRSRAKDQERANTINFGNIKSDIKNFETYINSSTKDQIGSNLEEFEAKNSFVFDDNKKSENQIKNPSNANYPQKYSPHNKTSNNFQTQSLNTINKPPSRHRTLFQTRFNVGSANNLAEGDSDKKNIQGRKLDKTKKLSESGGIDKNNIDYDNDYAVYNFLKKSDLFF